MVVAGTRSRGLSADAPARLVILILIVIEFGVPSRLPTPHQSVVPLHRRPVPRRVPLRPVSLRHREEGPGAAGRGTGGLQELGAGAAVVAGALAEEPAAEPGRDLLRLACFPQQFR